MRKFRNKKTGKTVKLDEHIDRHLIKDLEENNDWKELLIL